jgi:hypothetical protein
LTQPHHAGSRGITQVKDANEELGRMNVRLQEQSDDPLTRLWL